MAFDIWNYETILTRDEHTISMEISSSPLYSFHPASSSSTTIVTTIIIPRQTLICCHCIVFAFFLIVMYKCNHSVYNLAGGGGSGFSHVA